MGPRDRRHDLPAVCSLSDRGRSEVFNHDAVGVAALVKPWLSTGEAARILGVTRVTIRRWISLGYLESKRHPGKRGNFAIPRECVERFYAEHSGTSGTSSDSRVTSLD